MVTSQHLTLLQMEALSIEAPQKARQTAIRNIQQSPMMERFTPQILIN